VLATQNPIEQEGTYPLPEAQLDRFMFSIKVDYRTLEEERDARFTRSTTPNAPDFVKEQLAWGAGPRAAQALILGGKALALLHGRTSVTVEDVRALASPVLRHRLIPSFQAEADGVSVDRVIERLLETVE
jgi:MoxR-like ATPase